MPEGSSAPLRQNPLTPEPRRFASETVAATGAGNAMASGLSEGTSGYALGRRLPELRLLGQLARMYIVAEGAEGLYLVDQHAAHERVLFESLGARREAGLSQMLAAALPVELPPRHLAAIETDAEAFAALGFDLEPFGDNAALLRAVPEVMTSMPDLAAGLRDVLDAMEAGDDRVAEASDERLLRAVCKRAAVKAGQGLTEMEMRRLIDDLEACANPWTCPHGRPTILEIGLDDLERRFGRT
jgi:DNA mismatch repair protein MutL